jgi:hypothetical protein
MFVSKYALNKNEAKLNVINVGKKDVMALV